MESITEPTEREVELEQALEEVIDILEHKKAKHKLIEEFTLGAFAGEPSDIKVHKNDVLLLTPGDIDGKPAEYKNGLLIHPAQIGCTLSSAIAKLASGQAVWIDDGKIGAVVEAITEQGALLRITEAKTGGVSIKSDKGINFPIKGVANHNF